MNNGAKRVIRGRFLGLLVIAGLTVLSGCGDAAGENVVSITVKKGTFEILIPAFGELQAVKSTPIAVPAQVRGSQTIAWMAPENSMVKNGDPVVRFDSDWYHGRIRSQEFEIAKLNLEIGKKENPGRFD